MRIFGGLIDLPDIEPNDPTSVVQLEVEIRSEVAPFVGVELSFDIEAVVSNPVDTDEAFTTECLLRKTFEITWATVIIELSFRCEEAIPCGFVSVLERFNGSLDGADNEQVRNQSDLPDLPSVWLQEPH
jgi:hypothetical protein